ncbi:MAG TPA: hypothetical protein VMP08_21445 [Anaerolineae bacterium]|nr:hypothetical protein [Anaerolineae bacterium]
MNHWNLFKESWRIFWRNPALWLFGLLAALGGGYNLRYNFNFNFNPNFNPDLFNRSFNLNGQPVRGIPLEVRTLLEQIFSSQTFTTIVVIGIVWTIIAFLLVTYADGALMSMVNSIGGGQRVGVGFGFRAGAKRFLHLLAVRFILALPALILAIISGIVASQLVFNSPNDFGPAQFFNRSFTAVSGLGALAFVVALLMMAIGVSAERAVVIDEMPIWPSIVKGWKFLWGKFGDYFTIVILIIGLAIVAGIVFACVLVPFLCGAIGLGAASSANAFRQGGTNFLTALFVIAGPAVLIILLLGLLFGTLANVFTSSVWTLAYREWTKVVPPADTAVQPVAAPIEPIPPIEPLSTVNPPSNEPPAGGNA